MILNEASLLITGGIGSFGHAMLKKFLDSSIAEIHIFSQDKKGKTICASAITTLS